MYKCAVIKVDAMSIKENHFIIDRGGAAYIGVLGYGFKPPVSIHIHIWCVMNCPVQWNVKVDIFGLILGLVHNHGWNEAFPIIMGKYK